MRADDHARYRPAVRRLCSRRLRDSHIFHCPTSVAPSATQTPTRRLTRMKRILFMALALTASAASHAWWGEEDSVTVAFPGCNVISNQQIPGQVNLFIGRALFTQTGAPIAQTRS